MTVSILSALAK